MQLKIINLWLLVFLLLLQPAFLLAIEEGLPMLQQELLPDLPLSFQIQQKQSFLLSCSPQSSVIGKLHHQCHIHDAYVDIQTIMQIQYANSQRRKYLYNAATAVVYILNDTDFIAHSIGSEHHKQQDQQVHKFNSNCSKDMAIQFGMQKIFIFSCEAIYQMALSDSSFTMTQAFKNQEFLDIRSAQRYEDLIIVITYTKGVSIFAVDVTLNLVPLAKIYAEGQYVDAFYANNRLMLLERSKGLLHYRRAGNKFTYYEQLTLNLNLDEEIEYQQFQIWQNTTFITVEAQTQSFVVQLQTLHNKLYLVRYFKGYDEIIKTQIVNNSLIIHSNYKIDVFPINRDPRTIKQLLNGYSYSHDESVISFQHLEDDQFLLLKSRSATVTRWDLVDKRIECDFQETGTYSIMLEQPCSVNLEHSFRQACSRISIATITVYHKDTYIWLLLIIIGMFLAAVMLLIYWRENKVARIVHILQQIKNFQLKKKEIQFKEVHYDEEVKSRQDNELVEQKTHQHEEISPYEEYLQSERNNLN